MWESGHQRASSPRRASGCAGGCSAGSASAASVDRFWLAILFGFSTQILWVTTRGGVWHTGHLDRDDPDLRLPDRAVRAGSGPWLIGLLAGAAFLTRAPLAFAIPFYALLLEPRPALPSTEVVGGYVASAVRSTRLRQWVALGLGVLPAIAVLLRVQPGPVRVAVRVRLRPGDPAAVPRARSARSGLFSLAHVPMNLDYFLLHLPDAHPGRSRSSSPTGSGMSVFITSPGLLFAIQADWRRPRSWWLRGRDDRGPDPDPPLLRRRLAPVRLPLLPRFGAVRHRAVRAGGRPPRPGRARAGWR